MRAIEILLSLVNLLLAFALVARLPRSELCLRILAPVALLVAFAQVLVEGSRWQMIPAYVLSGVLCLVWLRRITTKSPLASHQMSNRITVGVGRGLTVVTLAVSIALPLILPVFHFPQPSGPYKIGTLTYHWTDASRPEIFLADPKVRRELMVQIWYPAKTKADSQGSPYMQEAAPLTAALARLKSVPELAFEQLKYVTTNAIPSAPVADDKPNFPVLIFLEGAKGFRQMNTFQVEELVSQGYIVVALDQPYTAASVVFPDGHQASGLSLNQMRTLIHQSYAPAEQAPVLNGQTLEKGIIPYLAQDVVFTLNQLMGLNRADSKGILAGRLDLNRAGTFGVSLGGIVVGEACRIEPRLRACLVMDATMPSDVVKAGLQQPVMWITRDAETMRLERRRAGGWSEAEISQHQTTMRATFEKAHAEAYFVQVPGMFHLNLTDVPYWSPISQHLGVAGPIDQRRAYKIINGYSLAFFDRHLRYKAAVPLDGLSKEYPEVIFQRAS